MRTALAVATMTLLLGASPSFADRPGNPSGDRFMAVPAEKTVYATDHHMGFSIRSTLISWLGGVPIVDERDLKAAQDEKWWGRPVPLLSEEMLATPDR